MAKMVKPVPTNDPSEGRESSNRAPGWLAFGMVAAPAATNSALIVGAPPAGSGTNGEGQLRGIKGPVYIPNSYAWIGWVLLGLALGSAAWWLWRKYRKSRKQAKPVITIPAHRRAKDRLRNASEMMSDPYAFCSLVSNVIRTYIEERFDLRAPERTTEEFLDELRRTGALHLEHRGLLEEFLTRCDLVKFARHEPSQPELQGLLDAALRFIDETTVVPAEVPQTSPVAP